MIGIEELKKMSILVYPGMLQYFWQSGKSEHLDISTLAANNRSCFATNNSIVCFVTEANEVFVTPYTNRAIKALTIAGFDWKNFYVPLSNGGEPTDLPTRERWQKLRQEAWEAYK